MSRKIFIMAGEASGDLHASHVIKELKRLDPGSEIFGVGGNRMRDAGAHLYYHIDEIAILGLSEVIRHFPTIRRIFHDLLRLLTKRKPDIVMLVDYPGFNLRFARRAHAMGFPVFYYIAPQVWAWGRDRAKKMARSIDRLAVIFEFEVDFFSGYGLQTDFVGHPLLDQIPAETDTRFWQRWQLDASRPLLALLPGSRAQEIDHLLPPMVETAHQLREKYPQVQVALALAETIPRSRINSEAGLTLVENDTHALLQHATAAIVASGTATLETAFFQVPFLITYRVSPLTWFLGKRLVKIPYIGLANVAAGEKVADEVLQDQVEASVLLPKIEALMFDNTLRRHVKHKLAGIRDKLGLPGAAKRVAELLVEEISH